MANDDKKKKVHSRSTPKYTTSSDEGSSSENEDDLISLFANLNMEQKKKLNELIETINEKDDLLECQEDLLVKENKKFVKLKNVYALEVEKYENLSKELNICHDSISSLRTENDNLVSKIEKLNVCNDSISCLRDENIRLNAKIEEMNVCKPSTSNVDHVTICTRCREVNIEAMDDHLAMIKQQNDHMAKLTAKIAEHEL
jgi:serine phosphatase RsbU (regulator of sigma subunit)